MSKLITTILAMLTGSVLYQAFLAEIPDYTKTATMAYWIVFTTVVFLINGIIKPKESK